MVSLFFESSSSTVGGSTIESSSSKIVGDSIVESFGFKVVGSAFRSSCSPVGDSTFGSSNYTVEFT